MCVVIGLFQLAPSLDQGFASQFGENEDDWEDEDDEDDIDGEPECRPQ